MMTYIDLMANPKYMDEFVSANFIPHTDVEKFPSVPPAPKVEEEPPTAER